MTSGVERRTQGRSGSVARTKRSESATEVAALLRRYHIRPTHHRGQNFLISDEVYKDILNAAELSVADTVLEVGAGLGTLTERLAARAGRVVAVEVDPRLTRLLRQRFMTQSNITIIEADILRCQLATLNVAPPYKVVANIPYYLTSQLLKKFLTETTPPSSLTLLVQREVAQRIVAIPGDMSLLALSVQLYSKPKIIRMVPASFFIPPPAVASALITITDVHCFPFSDVLEKRFWQVARIGFAAKRKQLINNLAGGFRLSRPDVSHALASAGIPSSARAQDLSLADWRLLTRILSR